MIKKMVFVISALRGGGAEKFVLNLYKAMEKYQGYQCHIVCIEKAIEHDINGYRVHFVSDFCNVSKKGLRRLTYKKNVARSVEQYISDKISKDALVLSNMLLADKIMSESTLRVHHVIHSSYYSAFLLGKGWLKKKQIKRKINATYKNHPLIFVSEASKREYESSFESKFSNTVIYNPTESGELEHLASATVDVESLGEYLVHIGRFNRAKRHDRLIDAFSKMTNTSVKLVLLGNGGLLEKAQQQVKALGLEDRVIFKGFLANPYPYLKHSKGLVLTSDFEGLPTVLIEAIALEKPVLTTNCSGGINEIVGDNQLVISTKSDLPENMDKMLSHSQHYTVPFNNKFSAMCITEAYHQLNLY
ncbi:glycosyltransferase [Vibrio sp. SBT000027]|uniref:glycosyltransferase n=1 Tax=Vibrio sp. SBT000027 TaxID=1803384 RepID=UPI000EF548A2|nr:glycosyltransferase [Vibrio sp. SBT000027]RLQ15544.1 glycosyltransferase [Vibrio sp. SBT000027]